MGLMDLLALKSDSLFPSAAMVSLRDLWVCPRSSLIFHILFNMLSLYLFGTQRRRQIWQVGILPLLHGDDCGLRTCWALLRWGQGSRGRRCYGAFGCHHSCRHAVRILVSPSHAVSVRCIPVKAWLLGIIIIVTNVFSSSTYVATDVHLVGAAFATVYFFGKWNFSGLGGLVRRHANSNQATSPRIESASPWCGRSGQAASPSKDESESDRILEKIHREGKDSLTSREREFLERYSREIREKRKQL